MTSALLTPEPEQPRANTNNPFTKDTESYVAKEKGKLKRMEKLLMFGYSNIVLILNF